MAAKMVEWHMRVAEEIAKRIDDAAAERGMNRTSYLLSCALCPQTVHKQSQAVDTNSPKNATNSPQTKERERDPRHGVVRELIMKCHLEAFKQECPWGAGEAGQLGHLLRKIPGATVQELEVMVRNRFRSEGIAPDSPKVWLGNLTRYGAGPLDKFGKTKRVMKAAPTEYVTSRYSAETMEKIRLANLDEPEEKAN